MKENKLTFQSQNLVVDYLTFNIQGTADFDLVHRIAEYLFQHFAFNSIISNCSKNKNHLFLVIRTGIKLNSLFISALQN